MTADKEKSKHFREGQETGCFRPGGLALTEDLMAFLEKYRRGSDGQKLRVLDIGCGDGTTLRYLRETRPAWELTGIDPVCPEDPAAESGYLWQSPDPVLRKGFAEDLPFPDHSFDVLLMECVFSRTARPEQALREALRVCRPEGMLLMSDLYIREEDGGGARASGQPEEMPGAEIMQPQAAAEAAGSCRVGRLQTSEEIMDRLRRAGFGILEFQDISRVLGNWLAERILNGGSEDPETLLGISPKELRRRHCGYFLGAFEPSPLWETLRYTAGKSAFYQKKWAGKMPDDISPGDWESFHQLPLTTPEEVSRKSEDLLCVPPKEIARIITLHSSGSTGKPKRLFFTEEDLDRTVGFFTWGMQPMAEAGDRALVFMEGSGRFTVGGLLKRALAQLRVETEVFGFVRDIPSAAAAAADREILIGVPSQMILLAKEAPDLRPKTVLLSADYVPEAGITYLESVWHCRVFTHWGMSETGYGGGVQCAAREAYHLRDEDLLVEILDPETGETLPAGEYGEVVLTTLRRQGMPLIRYRTGDVGRLRTDPCPCGCRKPRLDKVMGRTGGSVRLPDGRLLTIGELDERLLGIPGLRGFDAAWDPRGKSLRITAEEMPFCSSPEGKEILKKKILEEVCAVCGGEIPVFVSFGTVPLSDGVNKRCLRTAGS